ncbi:MAG: DUF2752 domain-containing protein [Lachnospiraceae bacterium]|nr:DUF2752 domain-containing protein [Lachnospiraceae bacterium]
MKRDQRKQIVTVVLAVIAVIVFLRLAGVTCLIKYMTGISCPGCGMTRAWIAFGTGHFHRAMQYHPLFLLAVPAAGYVVLRVLLKARGIPAERFRKWDYILLSIACTALFVCYAFRMADPQDTIVVFRPQDGVLFRWITWIKMVLR